jgi:hypothetical protein
VKFRDFDVFVSGDESNLRLVNLHYRAFVEAVFTALRSQDIQAPWGKFYVDISRVGTPTRFMPASPTLGLNSAGVTMGLPDNSLMTTTGQSIRPLLAQTVLGTRDLVRDSSGWDKPLFWDLVERIGTQVGPFSERFASVTDRKTKVAYHLTYEWDEDGTRLYADARKQIEDEELLGRTLVGDFPEEWEVFTGRVPSRIRLTPNGLELHDGDGVLIGTASRPA